MQLPFFDNIKYAIRNIYFNLTSLDSQIHILSNDTNHYLATKQKTLCQTGEHKKDIFHNYSFREHILLIVQYKRMKFSGHVQKV